MSFLLRCFKQSSKEPAGFARLPEQQRHEKDQDPSVRKALQGALQRGGTLLSNSQEASLLTCLSVAQANKHLYRCRCEQNQLHLCVPDFISFLVSCCDFDQPHCPQQACQSLLVDDYLCSLKCSHKYFSQEGMTTREKHLLFMVVIIPLLHCWTTAKAENF